MAAFEKNRIRGENDDNIYSEMMTIFILFSDGEECGHYEEMGEIRICRGMPAIKIGPPVRTPGISTTTIAEECQR